MCAVCLTRWIPTQGGWTPSSPRTSFPSSLKESRASLFDIFHIPWKENVHDDILSRLATSTIPAEMDIHWVLTGLQYCSGLRDPANHPRVELDGPLYQVYSWRDLAQWSHEGPPKVEGFLICIYGRIALQKVLLISIIEVLETFKG